MKRGILGLGLMLAGGLGAQELDKKLLLGSQVFLGAGVVTDHLTSIGQPEGNPWWRNGKTGMYQSGQAGAFNLGLMVGIVLGERYATKHGGKWMSRVFAVGNVVVGGIRFHPAITRDRY